MKKYIGLAILVMLGACSTAPRTAINEPVADIQKDYIVTDRNPDVVPDWAKDFSKFKRENDGKGQTFFIGESGDVADRVAGCDVGSLQAKKAIADQVASLIESKLAATKSGRLFIDRDNAEDPGMHVGIQQDIAAKSMAFLSGVKEYGQFWEERNYSKGGGKKRVYQCTVAVTIDDRSLNEAMRMAVRGLANNPPKVVEDEIAKAQLKEDLKDLDSQFRSYASTPKEGN